MNVEHRLSRAAVAVEHRAIALFTEPAFVREAGRATRHLSDQPIVCGSQIIQRRNVFPWDHQRMQRSLRVDVLNDDETIVFGEKRGRDFAGDNLAEEAVRHGYA